MKQNFGRVALAAVFSGAIFGQSAVAPAKFEIADVHVAAKVATNVMVTIPSRNGRYEFHNASIVGLIGVAYGFEPGRVVGGPSWLEMKRFDVIAKAPAGTKTELSPGSAPGALPDAVKEMFQSLLADRFKLVLHKDTRPLAGYALTRGKKLQMKEADGSGDTGCALLPQTDATTDRYFRYACGNMTMQEFAAGLTGMRGNSLSGASPVVDKTGLDGKWNFDLKWSTLEGVTTPDAIDQQLGLKLEMQQLPTLVIVVDRVNEQPTANLSGVAEAPQPTVFESASLKLTDPNYVGQSEYGTQPGGRVAVHAYALSGLITRAFPWAAGNAPLDLVTGVPDWAETERFDITAKAPADAPASALMLRSLLEDRLKLTWHTEERPVPAYTLLAGKPRMKKADPASRSHCIQSTAPAGAPPGSLLLNCQNITMSQLADQVLIPLRGPGQSWPILDSTGIKGGWDFTLTFKPGRAVAANSSGEPAQVTSSAPVAADPSGGLTIIEAVEKQLGLKLELRKRPMPVIVIDHLERKPTDN